MTTRILISYSPVFAVAGAGLLTSHPKVNSKFSFFLHRKIHGFVPSKAVSYVIWLGGRELLELSIGELLSCLAFLAVLAARFVDYYDRYPTWSIGTGNSGVQARFFRSVGELNFMTLALILLPITRHSVWLYLLGISFERAIKFHRAWGVTTLLIMAIHGIGMWITFATTTVDNPDANFAFVLKFETNPKTGWSNLSGFLSLLILVVSYIAATPFFRRHFFEIFLIIHLMCMPLIFLFGYLHMPGLLRYAVVSWILWGLDQLIQYYNAFFRYQTQITELKSIVLGDGSSEDNRVTRLTVTFHSTDSLLHSFYYQAGQYCFLRIPELSMKENHPFSISSSPFFLKDAAVDLTGSGSPTQISFHIKDMGTGTFTNKLNRLAQTCRRPVKVYVDGPFGALSIHLCLYPILVLIAGGIGATPCLSLLGDVVQYKRKGSSKGKDHHHTLHSFHPEVQITFLWTSREAALFEEFSSLLQAVSDSCGPKAVRLYTSDKSSKNEQIIRGRPDLKAVFEEAVISLTTMASPNKNIGVIACGPEPLLDSISTTVSANKTYSRQIHVHKEVFAF